MPRFIATALSSPPEPALILSLSPIASLAPRVRETLDDLRRELLAERSEAGHWIGELAPSALSTATAVSAVAAVRLHHSAEWTAVDLAGLVSRGVEYLRGQQNPDGGFGDTDRSHSNVATSYLVLAASTLAQRAIGGGLDRRSVERLRGYLTGSGSLTALKARYGKDQTFVVPILTNLAIAGLVEWDDVPRLPFEAAVFPQSMYRLLQMPVVSYAIPALVAIGQARHFHGRPAWLPLRLIRKASIRRTMGVLRRMQPQSGGYLEATPLTSFVVMSLAVTGRGDCDVARDGIRFLRDSMTADGSWPIDTNLATWLTSLAIQALAADPNDQGEWCGDSLLRWLLDCQHQIRHPFTGAEPGGWGWTDLSGAVPDSDDTPAAILALQQSRRFVCDDQPHGVGLRTEIDQATGRGVQWLLKLQNRNGGWPTFCRGWGKLPFDRSSTDLTAHAIRALHAVLERPLSQLDVRTRRTSLRAIARGVGFLKQQQRSDGSWLPLWFGNQDREDETNPVYGTARVLLAGPRHLGNERARRGLDYLLDCQNHDGGWGGGPSVTAWMARRRDNSSHEKSGGPIDTPQDGSCDLSQDGSAIGWSSMEETALAVEALAESLRETRQNRLGGADFISVDPHDGGVSRQTPEHVFFCDSGPKSGYSGLDSRNEADVVAIIRGVEFLLRSVAMGRHREPWPIGFYFAKLWYHERLYPLIFAVAALGSYLRLEAESQTGTRPPS